MEDKLKHTPGQWKFHAGVMEPSFVFTGDEDKPNAIAEVFLKGNFDHEQTNANGNLIAAAPELLDLLKRITTFHSDPFPVDDYEELLKKAGELIAKAENAE